MTTAALYDITEHPLLSGKYTGLKTDDERMAHQIVAEMLLGLQTPVYTGEDADKVAYAIVLQVNFQLQHGIEPDVVRSVSNTHPGLTTTYRDRYVSPTAWAVYANVAQIKIVGFSPPGIGV